MSEPEVSPAHRFGGPLRVAALVKQIPVGESMMLGSDGRLVRDHLELEMNAYCRRAVAKGVELAQKSGGSCTVFTMGPSSAEDVLREAIAWGADSGVHLCDPEFAGSDTLATAKALSEVLMAEGPFDLVFVGRNSLDGDTGQVGPEIAELLKVAFASGVHALAIDEATMRLSLQHDDGSEEVELNFPAVLSVAERLCDPCKVPPTERAKVPSKSIRVVTADELKGGPWGQLGSPTIVGATRSFSYDRARKVLSGPLESQVAEAVAQLSDRGALVRSASDASDQKATPVEAERRAARRSIAVMVEPGRPQVAAELLGAAGAMADAIGASVHALTFAREDVDALGGQGADVIAEFIGNLGAEDAAAALVRWSRDHDLWAVLGPSTDFGREALGRAAAALDAGFIGDAIGLEIVDRELVAAKPAFSGALVADITCSSTIRMVTVRPGVLPVPPRRKVVPTVIGHRVTPLGRIRSLSSSRNDDVEVLARAQMVIGVGAAVDPSEYHELSPLAELLGAQLAATRKVTDKGWAPRARQIGVTGRSIAPRLYVAVGTSGKFNHMVGVRSAQTILAINNDPAALVFDQCDIGIVGDWRDVVPALTAAIRVALRE
jgi:electron transfer flavoprotein alpha subunit